ncbi:toxin C-terminal domain-containing protein [Pseudomonas sp. CR3202]|uniref:two-partner secretion domain-containing protein n=1 Tax=Pseudomonas sp. CR3202 TaxID=3351532 RepID=UPI003BEF96C3
MDTRSPFFQNIALVLIGILFLDPIVATAAQLAVDQAAGGNTQLGQAGNGVPVVNIATPNASGLSHNRFREYNVGAEGLILNNATERAQASQLGGLILGNPNLQGRAAGTILNEVTGGNRSLLGGYTEVAGQSARVIVSNPHGLTCNGCGFINTPRATLTTGKPVLEAGRLDRFQVDGGDITLEGAGLNASNVDQFELITRSARLNAELHARDLTIVTGRNDVQADSLAATPRATDGGAAPALAIDSSALGGMYAGAIRLVGTEAGVGVKLAGDMAASAGDIRIDANGQVTLAQTAAARDLQVRAQGAELTAQAYAGGSAVLETREDLVIRQSLAAKDAVRLNSGGRTLNQGVVEAGVNPDNSRNGGGDVQLQAREVRNAGTLAASRNLEVSARQTLDNQGGTLSAQSQVKVAASKLDNRQGRVLAKGDLAVTADQLQNSQGGLITSSGPLDVGVGQLDNRGGEVSSQSNARLRTDSLDNRGGKVIAEQTLDLAASEAVNNQAGALGANQRLQLKAGSLDNSRQGRVGSQGSLDIQVADALDNSLAGQIGANGHTRVAARKLDNSQGGQLTSSAGLDLQAGQVDNHGQGRIASHGPLAASITGLDQRDGGQLYSNSDLSLDLNGGHLDNSGGLLNAPGRLLLKNLGDVSNRSGEISSRQAFTLAARSLDNASGKLLSAQALTLRLESALNNLKGRIAGAGVEVRSASLDNGGGLLTSSGNLLLQVAGRVDNRSGELSSAGAARLEAAGLDNRDGDLLGDSGLSVLLGGALDNRDGTLGSGGDVSLQAASLDNSQGGTLVADGSLGILLSGLLDNQGKGSLLAKGVMDIQAGRLDNRAGLVSGQGRIGILAGQSDNRGGHLVANGPLVLRIDLLDNREQGQISSKASLDYQGQRLDNQGGRITAAGPVQLNAREVQNGQGRIASQADLKASLGTLEQVGGELVAQGRLDLDAATLDNRQGGLVGSTGVLTLAVDQIDNRGGEISSQSGVTLSGQHLDNSGGKLLAGTDLVLAVDRVINQAKGLVFGRTSAALSGSSLDNSDGTLASAKALVLALAPSGRGPGGTLVNHQGLVSSEGTLVLSVSRLDNRAGTISSAEDLNLTSAGPLDNRGGAILTDAALQLASGQLDNSRTGRISARGGSRVRAGDLDNSQGGILTSGAQLDLQAAQVNNSGKGRIASNGPLNANIASLDQRDGGELFSKADLSLDLNQGELDNRDGGLINAQGWLLLNNVGLLRNQGGEISSQRGLSLAVRELDNNGGSLLSNQPLVLRIAQALNNVKGQISAAGLRLEAGSLDNSQGLISSTGDLDLVVAGQAANQGGELVALEKLNLQAGSLDNRADGLVGAVKGLRLAVGETDNRGGEISSQADASLSGGHLDNSGGKLLANGSLVLALDRLINQAKGLVSASGGLRLDGRELSNDGGTLASRQDLRLDLSERFSNRQGLVSGEGTLGIAADTLDNAGGTLSAGGPLVLEARTAMDNQGGRAVTDDSLQLHGGHLDNRKGLLSAEGAMQVRSTALDNRRGGQLIGGDTLSLDTGLIDNSDKGRIGSAKTLDVRATSLDQHGGGQLFSQSDLRLDLQGGALDNRGGLLNSPGQLLLQNLGDVRNQDGEISSQQAFTLAARNLDNSSGKLLSAQALTLRIEQALGNLKGLIAGASLAIRAAHLDNSGGTLSSRSDLDLGVEQLLVNGWQGLVSAAQALRLTSGSLDNRGGSLLAGTALDLSTGSLDNSGQGLINSQGRLTLASRQQLANDGGEISAKGELALRTGQFVQHQGRLIGESGVTLDLQGGDLDNQGGLILADGPLRLEHLRDLDNRDGEISSRESFALDLRHLDNRGGKLISNGQLGLELESANNQGGLLSGWLGLDLSGLSLDNSAGGTLSSRSGDLNVRLTGALLNRGEGALVSQGGLSVKAASLDNSDKGILSSGAGQTLELTDLLDNREGGLIDSGAGLSLKAVGLNNAAGTLQAQQDLMLEATDLDNSGGRIAGNGAVTLNLLGALTNIRGTLASTGPLLLQGASRVDNRGGQIASQGLLTLLTGSLDNRDQGTLAANGALLLTAGGAVQNSNDGLIYSRNAGLELMAASLDNTGGTLQVRGDLALAVGGALANLGGRLISQEGNVELEAATLDNRDGVFASLRGWVKARLGDWLDNSAWSGAGGVIQAQSLELAVSRLNNQGGHISALGGDARLSAGQLDNRQGGLFAKQLLQVSGTQVTNGGQIAAGAVDFSLAGALDNRHGIIESDSTLALAAASLDNRSGQLRALGGSGRTQLSLQGLFDNRGGVLESANHELGVSAGNFLNAGGKVLHVGRGAFDIDTLSATDGDGSLVTRGALTITADSWTNSSVLQAGSLIVQVGQFTQTAGGKLLASDRFSGSGGTWTNHGLLASDGDFRLDLSGSYSGSGRISSLGRLSLNSGRLDLPGEGRITGGDVTDIQVGGLLTNAGRITSASDLRINAGAISNFGTLGSAGQLRLVAPNLLNENGLIFSGADMTLRVDSFINRHTDLFSLGALDIAANDAGARSAVLENISSTLESQGDMRLSVSQLTNRKDRFEASLELHAGRITITATDNCKGKHCWALYNVKETYQAKVIEDSASASLIAGGHLAFQGDQFNNQNSLVSAAGDLSVSAERLSNVGAAGGYERYRTYEIYTRSDPEYWGFVQNQEHYNRYNDPSSADYDPGRLAADPILIGVKQSDQNLPTTGAVVAQAIIQAGGRIDVQASQEIVNGSLRPGEPGALGGSRVQSTATDANSLSTPARLNAQLPPDLAQQQVNPLNLPGFSLPSGENGLFRLSGQGGSAAEADIAGNAPQQWTMGGASVGLAQRERPLPDTQVREVQVSDNAQTGGSQLGLGDWQRTGGNGGSAGAIRVEVDGASVVTALPGRTLAGGGMTPEQVQAPDPSGGATLPDGQAVQQFSGQLTLQAPSRPHKYLIETNPELTSLKQFLSSDYLLGRLGYEPDQAQKRLGDGLYEQRLMREAVAARTGQRFLAGLTSDEAMFRYLMDNALASQQALNLSVGVGLSAAQVAALTHDIVWMEQHVVNGEPVLVPVLYLAQAQGRLAPNGALIQGRDVNLVSGGDLTNQGTLRASNNLSASGRDLGNTGLIEAGNRLDLLATDSIRNAQGGIIAGRDVSAIALTGDLVNERSVSTLEHGGASLRQTDSVLNTTARIEAANSLSLSAGRDLSNIGSVLSAGGNASLSAGRDLAIASVAEIDHAEGRGKKSRWSETSITQHGSEVQVGGDLKVEAGRDLAVIASRVGAGGDLELAAGRDLTIASAADESHYEYHYKGKGKKVDIERDSVRQQGSVIEAGGDITALAGRDLTLTASQVKAGDDAYLYAGRDLSLLAAEDSDFSLYDKKKKGSFGSKKTQRDEVTDIRYVGSEITTGGDLTLVSEGDQRYQKAKLESGADLTLDSGGEIAFEAVKDLHQESHEKSKGDLAWTSAKGKGTTDETLRQSELIAQGEIAIHAVDGLKVDLKHIDQQTVSQTIDAMVQADPNLAWIKELEQRGDVDWQRVKEVHDSFKYSHSGLGAGAQLAIAILVTYLTWGAGASLSGAAAGSVEAGVANSVVNAVAVNTVVSTINNKGNLGAAAKDITSSDSLKNYVAAGVSGGVAGGGTGLEIAVNSAMKTLVNGGKFKDNLTQAVIDLAANALTGAIYKKVGDSLVGTGIPTKVAVHAIVGGLIAEAAGGDFRTGALAAGANEALIDSFGKELFPGEAHERVLAMTSQLIGITVAAAAGGDEKAQEKAGWVAQQATVFNYLKHAEVEQMLEERAACGDKECRLDVQERWAQLDEQRNRELDTLCQRDLKACVQLSNELLADAPKIQALADKVRSSGDAGAATAIGWIVPDSNQASQNIITNHIVADRDGAGAGFWANAAQLIAGIVGGGKSSGGAKGAVYKTNKEAKLAAEALGFTKISETTHGGQAIYKNGGMYITRDLDGHNGGAWKMADSIKGLGSKNTRLGTYDVNLKRIGD